MNSGTLENEVPRNRRHFLGLAGTLTLTLTCGRGLLAAEPSGAPRADAQNSGANPSGATSGSLMQIGILLGTFARGTLETKLDAVKACGLDCVQLSMDCAGLRPMPDEIPAEVIRRIRREAAARGITIASVQGTFNMSHPDAEYRRTGLKRLRVLAGVCPELGAAKIHLCTGTRDPDNMWRRHPDNDSPEAWRDMAACVREAAAIARETGVVVAFEPEVNNVVDSAKQARRLLDEIGSPNLKVTMDAANLFHSGELARMSDILDQAFALVGRDIVMAHAKDISHDGDAGHEPAGHGKLVYPRYLSLLNQYGFKGPLLLHGLSEAQVPGCVAFLRENLARVAAARPKP